MYEIDETHTTGWGGQVAPLSRDLSSEQTQQ